MRLVPQTPRNEQDSKWLFLPDELWLHVFTFLSQLDLFHVTLTCKQLYRISLDPQLCEYFIAVMLINPLPVNVLFGVFCILPANSCPAFLSTLSLVNTSVQSCLLTLSPVSIEFSHVLHHADL